MTAPPAEGARIAWRDVPPPVRAAIDQICGAPVIEALDQPGGFSPGMAARIRCADGTWWFAKAASAEVNPDAPRLHRQEARVLAGLDPLIEAGRLPVPRLRGTAESGPWFALVADDAAGRQPELPWRDAELDAVLAALDQVAGALTPAPMAVPTISEYMGDAFTGWRALARVPADDRVDPWSRARLPELAVLEATWAAHAEGETLLHGDIRADNLLIVDGGVMVVDWPHAYRGAAFTDLVFFAPSVAMQGGPEPAALLARSRAGRAVSRDALAAVVCALAGYFTEHSLRPPPAGLPTLRRFQAAQGEVARRWLATLLLPDGFSRCRLSAGLVLRSGVPDSRATAMPYWGVTILQVLAIRPPSEGRPWMTERPTTWVGLWLQAALSGDRVRTEELRIRLNRGNPKGWTLDEPAVVRAAFNLAMDRYFDGRDDPPEVEAFAVRLREGVGERGKIFEVGLVQRLIRQSLTGEAYMSLDEPSLAVVQEIHMAAVKLATMESGMTDPEVSSLICQAEVLARDRRWNPPLAT